jgi:hypothetical protein
MLPSRGRANMLPLCGDIRVFLLPLMPVLLLFLFLVPVLLLVPVLCRVAECMYVNRGHLLLIGKDEKCGPERA